MVMIYVYRQIGRGDHPRKWGEELIRSVQRVR
jgi:hypothetical protein